MNFLKKFLQGSQPTEISPYELYDTAVKLIRCGDLRKGRNLLTVFEGLLPEHGLIPSALFWKAKAYLGEKDFKRAIYFFQESVDADPRGSRAPEGLLQMGLALLAWRADRETAIDLFRTIQEEFPKTIVAARAKRLVSELDKNTG